MENRIYYHGGLRLGDFIKAVSYGEQVKIISERTGKLLLQNAKADKGEPYWGLELIGIHSEMQMNHEKDYARPIIVCSVNEEDFYNCKNGATFEEKEDELNA